MNIVPLRRKITVFHVPFAWSRVCWEKTVDELKPMFLAALELTTDKDVIAKVADAHWAYLNALTLCGFTRDEALQLLIKAPLIGGQSK